jgi:hypothetical protein
MAGPTEDFRRGILDGEMGLGGSGAVTAPAPVERRRFAAGGIFD